MREVGLVFSVGAWVDDCGLKGYGLVGLSIEVGLGE